MKLEWNEDKRQATLAERGLDFADCAEVFEGITHSFSDKRKEYGEPRIISVGFLKRRMVVIVYTPRGVGRRIISMRYANERERKYFNQFFRS
jgi:uncharacterized DUF497 family protein